MPFQEAPSNLLCPIAEGIVRSLCTVSESVGPRGNRPPLDTHVLRCHGYIRKHSPISPVGPESTKKAFRTPRFTPEGFRILGDQ
jgi:hypothetical protein